jgi:aromatic ring-opening dioxygenase catalytic subunit (LigB family)
MLAGVREMHKRLRDAISRGESITVASGNPGHSFREMPLRERAKEAGVDENDPLLVRALELQQKATD